MKKIFQLSALALLPASSNIHAHHPVTDTVDEMGGDMIETSITADSLSMFETLVARGDLLEYVELLDDVVDASISFNDDGSVTMTVSQVR